MDRLTPRDVIRAFDRQVRTPNWKRLICVCQRRRFFLRINSEPIWHPHVIIRQLDCRDFLNWDSYVELQELMRVGVADLSTALARDDNPLGRLNDIVAREIAVAARQATTLSDERRAIVWEGLVGRP
jgi:hypothetical protein